MLISEMIAQLENIQKEHGDIQIFQHGHQSSMATIDEPKVNIIEMTEGLASRVIWNSNQNIQIGESFAWL